MEERQAANVCLRQPIIGMVHLPRKTFTPALPVANTTDSLNAKTASAKGRDQPCSQMKNLVPASPDTFSCPDRPPAHRPSPNLTTPARSNSDLSPGKLRRCSPIPTRLR